MVPEHPKNDLQRLATVSHSISELDGVINVLRLLEEDADAVAGKPIDGDGVDSESLKAEEAILKAAVEDVIEGHIDFQRFEAAVAMKLNRLVRVVKQHATRHLEQDTKTYGVPVVVDSLIVKPDATVPLTTTTTTTTTAATAELPSDAEEAVVPNNGGATCTIS